MPSPTYYFSLKQLTPPLIGELLEMKVQILTLYRSLKDNLFLQHIDEPNFEEQLEEANNLEELVRYNDFW